MQTEEVFNCIVGPTAAGKSALSMALAEARNLAIVSADSRQVYRDFNLGTAKPTLQEMRQVPHFGINILDPSERYSAHQWAQDALGWCETARSQGREPLIAGGTGLYIRALVEPFDPVPGLNQAQRLKLMPWLDSLSRDELVRWCRRLDPARSHLGRTQLLRAVETVLLTGTRISEHLGVGDRRKSEDRERLRARYLVVDPGARLAGRIEDRTRQMIAQGLLDEVARLRHVYAPEVPAWNACGYRVLRDALEGRSSIDAAIERVIVETRQYAKRQRTWFRNQLPAHSVTLLDPSSQYAVDAALAWWDAGKDSNMAQFTEASSTRANVNGEGQNHS